MKQNYLPIPRTYCRTNSTCQADTLLIQNTDQGPVKIKNILPENCFSPLSSVYLKRSEFMHLLAHLAQHYYTKYSGLSILNNF